MRVHRPLQGDPKTCTISRKADGWYCSIACKVEPEPLEKTGQEVGIDVGIENFATLSEDHPAIANPRFLQKAQAKLCKAQRRLERRTRRDKRNRITARQSHRRAKAKALVARAHLRVARARLDFHQKVAHALVRQFDVLYVENLNVCGMLKNRVVTKG